MLKKQHLSPEVNADKTILQKLKVVDCSKLWRIIEEC